MWWALNDPKITWLNAHSIIFRGYSLRAQIVSKETKFAKKLAWIFIWVPSMLVRKMFFFQNLEYDASEYCILPIVTHRIFCMGQIRLDLWQRFCHFFTIFSYFLRLVLIWNLWVLKFSFYAFRTFFTSLHPTRNYENHERCFF